MVQEIHSFKMFIWDLSKDSGSIYFQNQPVNFVSSKDALTHGVSMVHQELNQVLQSSVMDNIWLGRYPKKHGFADQKMYDDTEAIFLELDMDIDPKIKWLIYRYHSGKC